MTTTRNRLPPDPAPRQHAQQRLLTRRGLMFSLALCVAILGLGGVGFWLLEPRALTLSDGLWLAFTTAATVGYGDIVPTTHASRVFAVLVVLLGLAVLSLVTASLAALFIGTEEREIERDLLQVIGALRHALDELREEVRGLKTGSYTPEAQRTQSFAEEKTQGLKTGD